MFKKATRLIFINLSAWKLAEHSLPGSPDLGSPAPHSGGNLQGACPPLTGVCQGVCQQPFCSSTDFPGPRVPGTCRFGFQSQGWGWKERRREEAGPPGGRPLRSRGNWQKEGLFWGKGAPGSQKESWWDKA